MLFYASGLGPSFTSSTKKRTDQYPITGQAGEPTKPDYYNFAKANQSIRATAKEVQASEHPLQEFSFANATYGSHKETSVGEQMFEVLYQYWFCPDRIFSAIYLQIRSTRNSKSFLF